ncbi:MAG: hypothetical protein KDI63_16270 [Gammaproteobacteria bacterium]|nr:hypothetical protein [Gammaproteobacteria bacterium]
MPYFVYRIDPGKELHCLAKYDKYRDAKLEVQALRKTQESDDAGMVRMIHASSQIEAERLLLTPREAPVEGDD